MFKNFYYWLANVYVDTGLPDTDGDQFATNLKNLMFAVAGVLALYFLVTAGFKYVTSGGNAEQTKKATQTIIFACLGLFLILMSYAIITWVFKVGTG